MLGRPRLAADERLGSHHQRVDHRDELESIFEPIFKGRTAAQWFAMLDAAGVPCELCSNGYWRDYLTDPWSMKTGRVVEYFQGDLQARLRQFGKTIRFSQTPQTIQGPPPVLGEHTRRVLDDLGYSTQEQEDLKRRGVVSWPQK